MEFGTVLINFDAKSIGRLSRWSVTCLRWFAHLSSFCHKLHDLTVNFYYKMKFSEPRPSYLPQHVEPLGTLGDRLIVS